MIFVRGAYYLLPYMVLYLHDSGYFLRLPLWIHVQPIGLRNRSCVARLVASSAAALGADPFVFLYKLCVCSANGDARGKERGPLGKEGPPSASSVSSQREAPFAFYPRVR